MQQNSQNWISNQNTSVFQFKPKHTVIVFKEMTLQPIPESKLQQRFLVAGGVFQSLKPDISSRGKMWLFQIDYKKPSLKLYSTCNNKLGSIVTEINSVRGFLIVASGPKIRLIKIKQQSFQIVSTLASYKVPPLSHS